MNALRLLAVCVLLGVGTPAACQRIGDFRDSFETSKLNSAWTALDIGAVSASRSVRSGALRIAASGGGIGGAGDQFSLTYLPVHGSFAAEVRLTSLTKTVGRPNAGLMVRASGDPGAAFVSVGTDGAGVTWTHVRSAQSEPVAAQQGQAMERPLYLRLARIGSRFHCSVSSDGLHFRSLLDLEVPLPPGVLLGLYVCSGEEGKTATAVFDEFRHEALGAGLSGDVVVRVKLSEAEPLWWPYVSIAVPGVDGERRRITDDLGFVWFHGVPPGPACLHVTCAGYHQSSADVLVRPGEVSVFELRPDPLPSLDVGGGSPWRLNLIGGVSPATDSVDLSTGDCAVEGWADAAVPLSWSALKLAPWQYGWYQVRVDVPQSWAPWLKHALLLDGLVFDGSDWVYWNGRLVGRRLRDRTGVRRYVVPAGVWHTGVNVLAVRGMSENGDGGAGGITSGAVTVRVWGPFGSLQGQVFDACGGPAPSVAVVAECGDTEYGPVCMGAETGVDGRFNLAGLPAGRYVLRVQTDGRPGGDVLVEVPEVTVSAGEVASVEVRTGLSPTIPLVAEAGYGWIILVGGVDAAEDHSAVGDAEFGFRPLAVTEDHGAWGMLNTDSRSYGWLRLRFRTPKRWALQYRGDLCLWGYDFDDVDRAYVNGIVVGQTGRFPYDEKGYAGDADRRRRYTVPASAVAFDGENVIAIKGYKALGQGGFRNWRPLLTPLAAPSGPTEVLPGDANADGQVTVADAVLVLRAALGQCELDAVQILAGDIDCDGELSVADAVRILRKALDSSGGSTNV
ncbi:MAG: carboxypeptidase regulatory-like domain-containing protein [Armatimonadota bacterium]